MTFKEKLTNKYLKLTVWQSAVFVVYFFSGKLGLSLAFINQSASAVWPPTGIALATFLLFGSRFWPAIFFGAFFVNLTTSGDVPTSLGIALGNTLEGLVGAYLIKRFAGGKQALSQPLNIYKFVALGGSLATAISATLGTSVLVLGGLAPASHFNSIWFTWWLGDMSGALIVAPFLISAFTEEFKTFKPLKFLEGVVLFFSVLLVSEVVFGSWTMFGTTHYPVAFFTFPVILWAASRFGRRESTTAILLLSALAITGTLQGYGPFFRGTENESLLLVQGFTIIISVTALALSAAISESKRLEGRFRGLIEFSSDAISLIDEHTKVLYTSPATFRVLGYSPEEFVGMNGLSLVDVKDRERIVKLLSGLMSEDGKSINLETKIKRKDGQWIWVEAVLTNLLNEPAVSAIVVNYRDMSETKRAQAELLSSARKLAEEKTRADVLLESIGESIVATDNAGKVMLVNKAFEDLFGWHSKELKGKKLSDFMVMENSEGKPITETDRPVIQALSRQEKVTGVYYLSKKDHTKFPGAITATPLLLDKQIIGGIKVVRDITVERQIDKAKSEFVSLASHQLRTPLTIMKWQSSELVDDLKSGEAELDFEKYRKRANNVYVTNQRMIELVNSILNVSKIDLGTLAIEPTEISPTKILEDILDDFEDDLEIKKFKLKKIFPTKELKAFIDPQLVRIILQNLLTNSIKYTPPRGQITLKYEQQNSDILFSISDTGCGIPAQDQSKIFTKFFRTEMARQIDPNGNGLGMYAVKAIVGEVGGKIWFESKVDKGSIFYVKIPLTMRSRTGAKDFNEAIA